MIFAQHAQVFQKQELRFHIMPVITKKACDSVGVELWGQFDTCTLWSWRRSRTDAVSWRLLGNAGAVQTSHQRAPQRPGVPVQVPLTR